MRVGSSSAVIERVEGLVHLIIDTYFTPNRTFSEFRELMDGHTFSAECRAKLQALNDR
jgi:hypothetical protein